MAGSSVIGALRVNLGLDSAQFSTGVKKANAEMAGFQRSMLNVAGKLSGIFAGIFTIKAVGNMADQWSDMSSRVGVAVKNMDAAPAIMERISAIASMTYSPLAQTAEGFIENSASLRELGYSTEKVLDYTEALNNALVVSGAKGERAASVQRALSVAMATGKLSGDGLNTVLSSGGRIAEALAKELGTTRNGLIALASKGKITADVIGRTLLKEMQSLRVEAEQMPATIGDGFTLIGNALTSLVGRFDQATGASATVAAALKAVADAVNVVAEVIVANAGSIVAALQLVASTAAVVAAIIITRYVAALAVSLVSATVTAIGQMVALEMALGAQSVAAALAGVATKALSTAMIFLRGAIMATGIGALVIGAGYLVSKFIDLVRATGGFSGALSAIKEVAVEVWDRIAQGSSGLKSYFIAAGEGMQGAFLKAFAVILSGFAALTDGIARGWNALMSSIGVESNAKGLGVDAAAAMHAEADALIAGAATSVQIGSDLIADAMRPLESVAAINAKIAESAGDAATSLGETGLGGAIATTGDKAGGAKAKLSDFQKVIKSLREEAEKLRATMGMTDLQADIWAKQREAGVQASSAQGQQIDGLMVQIDKMKRLEEVTEDWKQSVSSAFSEFILKGGSFKDMIGQLISKLAEMAFNKGFEALWGAGLGALSDGIMAGLGLGANANGTNNWQGGLSRVHERGGEIMNLPKGTQVIPHDISKRMADKSSRGAGGGHMSIGFDQSTGSITATMFDVAGRVVEQARSGIVGQSVSRSAKLSRSGSKSAFGVR